MARWTMEQYEAYKRLHEDVKAAKAEPRKKGKGGKTKDAMIKGGEAKGDYLVSMMNKAKKEGR